MSRKKYIDRIDLELLNTLRANPKMTVAELGEAIDLTPGPTHTRLTRLNEEQFFSTAVEIDYSKLGFETYCLIYKQDDPDKGPVDIDKLQEKITTFLEGNGEGFLARILAFHDLDTESYGFSIVLLVRKGVYSNSQLIQEQDKLEKVLYPGFTRSGFTHLTQINTAHVELDRKSIIRHKPE